MKGVSTRRGGALDLVVVGMGSGGMTAVEFAADLGLRVAVVERGRIGGDCLWTGCVPSKALLASAKAAHTMRTADRWGLPPVDPDVDTELVWKRIKAVQESIATTDEDPERFRRLGVDIHLGTARLVDPHTVVVEQTGVRLSTRFVLLCTGSEPSVPRIEGLAEAGYLTNESLFELDRPPASLVVIGGGPIGVEFAQALRRLGSAVSLLEQGPRILPRDEPDLVRIIAERLVEEGVGVHTGVEVERVTTDGSGRRQLHGTGPDPGSGPGSPEGRRPMRWEAAQVLVAVGRRPSVEGLGLEALGVAVGAQGVEVDERGRTNLPSVYAAGDVVGRALFTHVAGHDAVRAVRDMFFPGRGAVSEPVPWCTFTDPELAHVGLTEAEASERYGARVQVWRLGLDRTDRARAESATEGALVAVTARGRLVGASVAAPAAGEVIHELALAVRERMRLTDLSGLIHVYPTIATGVAQLAAQASYRQAQRYRWLLPLTRMAQRASR